LDYEKHQTVGQHVYFLEPAYLWTVHSNLVSVSTECQWTSI